MYVQLSFIAYPVTDVPFDQCTSNLHSLQLSMLRFTVVTDVQGSHPLNLANEIADGDQQIKLNIVQACVVERTLQRTRR